MTHQFDMVQRLLSSAGQSSGDVGALTGPHRRLIDAWHSDLPGADICGDIAALLGQVLRNQRGITGQANGRLRLGLDAREIPVTALDKANLKADRYGVTEHHVSLGESWSPEWLYGDLTWIDLASAGPGPFVTADGAKVSTYARPDTPVPVDPAVKAIAPGIDHYRSRSQASAVRTATLIDPDSTLHVVLPTGTGKSIVGLAPGLLAAAGTTVTGTAVRAR